MRDEVEKGWWERASLREREWRERPKEREEREAQVAKREVIVRWVGRVE
jgi:ribosomal protein S21